MQRPVGLQHEVLDSLVDIFEPNQPKVGDVPVANIDAALRWRAERPDELEIRRRQRELQQRDTTRAGRRSS